MPEQENSDRGLTVAQIVRIHESNCSIDFPSSDEQNFRIAVMKDLARRLNLKELRATTITGPATGMTRPAKVVGK